MLRGDHPVAGRPTRGTSNEAVVGKSAPLQRPSTGLTEAVVAALEEGVLQATGGHRLQADAAEVAEVLLVFL